MISKINELYFLILIILLIVATGLYIATNNRLISSTTKIEISKDISKNSIAGNEFSYTISNNKISIVPYVENDEKEKIAQEEITYKVSNLQEVFHKMPL